MVKRNVSKWNPAYYYHFTDIKLDQIIEAKYIRTTIHKMMYELRTGVYRPNDAMLQEQWFNLKELPKDIFSKERIRR